VPKIPHKSLRLELRPLELLAWVVQLGLVVPPAVSVMLAEQPGPAERKRRRRNDRVFWLD
jgi:hypothetical protein